MPVIEELGLAGVEYDHTTAIVSELAATSPAKKAKVPSTLCIQ